MRTLRRPFRMRILDRHGIAVLCRSCNGLLAVEAGDFSIGRTLLKTGKYDWDEIQWLRDITQDQCGFLLVVGGHVGSLAVPLAENFRNVQVFEADPRNFELLSINLKLNDRIHVQAFNLAVGAKTQMVGLTRNNLNTGNTSVGTLNKAGQSVEMVRLDAVLPDQTIDLMVMDIEGHEPQAIAGAGLLFDKVQKLYMEFAPNHLRAQGNDPEAFFRQLCRVFPYRNWLHKKAVNELLNDDLSAWLARAGSKKDFVENVLFSREPLQPGSRIPSVRKD